MCDPLLFGTAAVAATETTAAVAATSGLIGTGGAFALAPALMTAGTALSIGGQLGQGAAMKEASTAQAQQALNDAAYREDAAKSQAEKIRRAGRAQVGEANASLAASGVKLGEGTALEIQKKITTNAEEDALSAILSGKRITSSAQKEADLLGRSGDNAQTSAIFGSAGSALQAGAAIKGGWRRTIGGY